MTILRWGSATDVGMVRETNQDSMLTDEPLFAVADGMGGHQGGEVASATALEILSQTFDHGSSKDDLVEAVRRANAKVWDKAQLDENLHGMGTTLTAIASIEDDGNSALVVVNVGDSRVYLMREGELTQLTSDHSFVEEMVRAGEISPEEAESHPKRNILTRALGVEPTVEADIDVIVPQADDRILLCSDGLVRELTDTQIAGVLRRLKDPGEAARELVSQAKAHGGHDNITVVIVDVESKEQQPIIIDTPTKTRRPRRAKSSGGFKVTFSMLGFFSAAIILIAIGVGSVVWYARSSYYVGLEGEQLVIYQGRPDKVLWFESTIAERSNVLIGDVLPKALPDLQAGATQSSLRSAQTYIANLHDEAIQARGIPETTSTTTPDGTTSTLVP